MSGGWAARGEEGFGDPNIIYLDSYNDGRYLQKPSDYADYERIWDAVHAQSVPLKEFSP